MTIIFQHFINAGDEKKANIVAENMMKNLPDDFIDLVRGRSSMFALDNENFLAKYEDVDTIFIFYDDMYNLEHIISIIKHVSIMKECKKIFISTSLPSKSAEGFALILQDKCEQKIHVVQNEILVSNSVLFHNTDSGIDNIDGYILLDGIDVYRMDEGLKTGLKLICAQMLLTQGR